ncbi:hypothetical protein BKA65DRAFT_483345 [Rhexocercosporidium sp. MPI-PUGE-AT-0058]|nr:hypothetical protein BKA65DRAFT_483345 [Rhexocercosporidium sp. MPI-PUGE-AT-0058]
MEQAPFQAPNEAPMTPHTKLTRLADIVQAIFYKFRLKTYDAGLKKIEYLDGIMYTYDAIGEDYLSTAELLGMCDGENDEKSLLVRFGCTQAVALMGDMLMYGVAEINCRVTVTLAKMKEPHRKFIRVSVTGERDLRDPVHEFFKITLLDTVPERSYALDLSSAQYGYYNPLVLFEEYVEERVLELKREESLGVAKHCFSLVRDVPGRVEWKRGCAEGIFYALRLWERRWEVRLGEMLCLYGEEFCRRKMELLDSVDEVLAIGDY